MFQLQRTPPVERRWALARALHPSGARVTVRVRVAFPVPPLLKGGFGKVYSDADGNFRWITVHPHGDDEPGVPVKVRESKTQRGMWHIVGGAKGKLNFTELHLGTTEEMQARWKEKARKKKERKDKQQELEAQRKDSLSEEERQAEQEAEREREAKRQQAAVQLRTIQQEQVADIAKHLGWDPEEWQFEATAERLKQAGASPERIEKLEEAHFKRVYQRAQDAIRQTKRQLLAQREETERLLADQGGEEKVGLTDLLEAPKTPRGKGFQSVTKKSSDSEIRAALAAEDQAQLAEDLTAAQEALENGDEETQPAAVARVQDLRARLHTAQLLEQAETMTPEEIADRRADVKKAVEDVQTERGDYKPELMMLRGKEREDGIALTPTEKARLGELEHRFVEDERRLETLKSQSVDLAVMAGETKPAISGERAQASAEAQMQREDAIREEHGEEGVERYRLIRDMMRAGTEKYQAEMRDYRETGVLRKLDVKAKPVTDAEQALQLVARQKAIQKLERDLQRAETKDADVDPSIFGKGYFDKVGEATPEMIAEVERDFENTIREEKTRAFLSEAESPELLLGRGGEFSEGHDEQALHRAMERHLGAGAYNALNNAALAAVHGPLLSRDVVDTLGATGAAQLLAHTLRQQEDKATIRAMVDRLGAYHVSEHVEGAEDVLREAEEHLDAADEAIQALTNPEDVAVALEANRKRERELEEARALVGQALGEYEATGALVKALGTTTKEIETNFGPTSPETVIRQLRALGLERADYTITSDGTNYFAKIKESGFGKLTQPIDPAAGKLHDDVMAIKRGEQDEIGWMPKGTISRTKASFDAEAKEPPPHPIAPLGEMLASRQPAAHADAVREHIALRAANGEDPSSILTDLHANLGTLPEGARQAAADTIDTVFPLMKPLVENGKPIYEQVKERVPVVENGKPTGAYEMKATGEVLKDADGNPVQRMVPTTAEEHRGAVQDLVRAQFKKLGLDATADINGQHIDAEHPHTLEAITRALSQEPRAAIAFTAVGDLTSQDQQALRHYFASRVAKQDVKTGADPKAVEQAIAALGPEPAKEKDLFSGQETETQAGAEWRRQRDQILADAEGTTGGGKTTSWPEYVTLMGGTANAYRALQDRAKSDFLKTFHQAYTTLHGAPLRVGTRAIANAERHLGYLDPAKREALLAEHRQLLDEARNRVKGQYAAGSVREKIGRIAQAEEIARQNQMGLVGATPTATSRKAPDVHERFTLGQTVEGQLAQVMPEIARNFRVDEPVKLLKGMAWNDPEGTPKEKERFIHQQRTVKHFARVKRLAAALGTGSGKTFIGIGALQHLRNDAKSGVKRGLFVVPSKVQGQFGGEFTRLVEPGSINWSANPGASRAQRLADHRNADLGGVVMTHQGFRDDMLSLVAEHLGKTPEQARDHVMGLDRKATAGLMREVWDKNGIDYQMVMADEAHGLLDRDGKPDSLVSRMMEGVTDNTPYYMSATADPVKNDVSELRSLMDKLHPDGRYGDAAAWKRRYGVNTTAAAEALQREVSPYMYAAEVKGTHKVNRHRDVVPMHPAQAKRYGDVMQAFEKLRAGRAAGKVDVEAAKVIAPYRFEGKPEAEHEAIARGIQKNPGSLKEEALKRVVEEAPRHENAKIQKIRERLKSHPVKDKPVVIFAGRLKAVDEITEALAEDGHRVEKLTGADSGKVQERKLRRFKGDNPDIDVFVVSNAAEAGVNLQRGQTLIQYDMPHTPKTHAQRSGRIDRQGQYHDEIDLIDMATDSPYEARAAERVEKKYELRRILTDPATGLDETGFAQVFREARQHAAEQAASPLRKVA